MRRVLALLLPLALAGCAAPDTDRDGKATVYVVNAGPPATVALVDESADVVWTARLVEDEARLVVVNVRVGGCMDYKLLAGYNGTEPHVPVRLVAPCDADSAPTRLEFWPPRGR